MKKTILLTGATDGIGLEAAKVLASEGHRMLLHGRNPAKLESTIDLISSQSGAGHVEGFLGDLFGMDDVEILAAEVLSKHDRLDVLVNNAGVFRVLETIAEGGLDVRFAVNTLAPYLLLDRFLPLMNGDSRVVNLSSAAQSPVNVDALSGAIKLADEFAGASGLYYDNDAGEFGDPHPDALDRGKCENVARVIEAVLAKHLD